MFIIKFIPATISLILLFLLSFGIQQSIAEWKIPSPITSNNFIEHKNTELGYKVKYPDNWNKLESTNYTLFYPPLMQEETEENPSIYLKIANTSLPDIPLSLQSIVDETVKNLNSTLDNFKLLNSNKIFQNNDNNRDANLLVYTYKKSDEIIKTQDIGYIVNNDLFLISYVSNLDNYYKYLPTIEKMGESFELLPEIEKEKILNQVLTSVHKNVNFLGKNSANITMVEFGDYQSSFGERFHKETKGSLIKSFVNTGKVKYIFKDFIVNDLTSDKTSTLAAEASYCAAEQKKYWAYHDKLFGYSEGENTGWVNIDNLNQFANQSKIPDLQKFLKCVESHKYNYLVTENDKLAKSIGLTSTPSFILYNGTTPVAIQGQYPYSVFEQVINEML